MTRENTWPHPCKYCRVKSSCIFIGIRAEFQPQKLKLRSKQLVIEAKSTKGHGRAPLKQNPRMIVASYRSFITTVTATKEPGLWWIAPDPCLQAHARHKQGRLQNYVKTMEWSFRASHARMKSNVTTQMWYMIWCSIVPKKKAGNWSISNM